MNLQAQNDAPAVARASFLPPNFYTPILILRLELYIKL